MSIGYQIELDRFGIKPGIPVKPYTDADYIQADLNVQGLSEAMKYARSQGYVTLTLPAGEYSICYPRPVQMINYMILNIANCTIKTIYDSDRKSPFDNRTGTDYYNFIGTSFTFAGAEHAQIINGKIIGCREDRSFTNPAEVAVEHTYGVKFERSARFNKLSHVDISEYMGDNVSFLSSAHIDYVEFDEGCTVASLDYKTGLPAPTNKTVITKMLDLKFDPTKKIESFYVGGSGYARLTSLNNKFFDVFFYDKNNAFIGVSKRRRIYSDISIPKNATKYRFQFLDETVARNHALTVWFGYIPSHNVVEDCIIRDGHRGGVTLGGSYNKLINNQIFNNGKGNAWFMDGKPLFNDPTRYAINMEDSFGSNCLIEKNNIYGSFHGILVGCFDVEIKNNHIHDIDFNAINLYAVSMAKIIENTMYNNMNNIGLNAPQFYYPYVLFEKNNCTGGTLNFNAASAYRIDIKNCKFENPVSMALTPKVTMSDCHIIYTENVNATWIQSAKLKNCTFMSSQPLVLRELIIKSNEIDNCVFENLRVRYEALNNKVATKVKITNSSFTACEIRNHNFYAPVSVDVIDSELTDTTVQVGITNVENINPSTKLYNCKVDIVSSGMKQLFVSDCNKPYATYIAEKCEINIANPSFAYMLNSGALAASNELILQDNEIKYTGTTPTTLNLNYYKNAAHIKNFVLDDKNTFTNINAPVV